jgi:hypothetical protein
VFGRRTRMSSELFLLQVHLDDTVVLEVLGRGRREIESSVSSASKEMPARGHYNMLAFSVVSHA